MGIVTGKSGKTYVLNLDNLGGYQMGQNKLDAIPVWWQNENSVYAGAGVYPGEGGYVYIVSRLTLTAITALLMLHPRMSFSIRPMPTNSLATQTVTPLSQKWQILRRRTHMYWAPDMPQ